MKGQDLLKLERRLVAEEVAVLALRQTPEGRRLSRSRQELISTYRELSRSADLVLKIRAEKLVLEGDQLRYANSPAMKSSLKTAIAELNAVLEHIELLADSAKYYLVNRAHSLPKRRDEHGRPLDEAREALNSHITRLSNLDRSRLDEDEKGFIDERKASMRGARDLYIGLQEGALAEVRSALIRLGDRLHKMD